ncbi:hypothetical protein AAZX31_06G158200 [Glycine max]
MFPHALLELLSMHNSDHNPLLLSCVKAKSKRVKSFHFQAAWMSHPDYAALVQHTWVSTIGNVHRKLDYIQKKSTKFNERVLGDIFKRNCQIEARIKGVHKQLDTFPYSHFIIWRNNFRPNIIRYSIRSEFCGIKNQGNNGLSLITRIPHFSIHKQSSEEEEIGYYTLILEVFGVLMIRS